jgi:hypothetical protein
MGDECRSNAGFISTAEDGNFVRGEKFWERPMKRILEGMNSRMA